MKLLLPGTVVAVLLLTVGGVYAEGSAEAILRGLQQAQSRLADSKADEEKQVPAKQEVDSVAQSSASRHFVCTSAELERRITVEYPAAETGYACRVLYDTEKGQQVPWRAINTREYCEPHALGLVQKHTELGWHCTEQ